MPDLFPRAVLIRVNVGAARGAGEREESSRVPFCEFLSRIRKDISKSTRRSRIVQVSEGANGEMESARVRRSKLTSFARFSDQGGGGGGR